MVLICFGRQELIIHLFGHNCISVYFLRRLQNRFFLFGRRIWFFKVISIVIFFFKTIISILIFIILLPYWFIWDSNLDFAIRRLLALIVIVIFLNFLVKFTSIAIFFFVLFLFLIINFSIVFGHRYAWNLLFIFVLKIIPWRVTLLLQLLSIWIIFLSTFTTTIIVVLAWFDSVVNSWKQTFAIAGILLAKEIVFVDLFLGTLLFPGRFRLILKIEIIVLHILSLFVFVELGF